MVGITIWTAVAFAAGLVVGWNLLPQPAIVKEYYDKAIAYIKAKFE